MAYQNLMRQCNETRNTDLRMKILRVNAKSQELLIINQEENENQERLNEIRKQLNIKKFQKYMKPDLDELNNYKVLKRRNSAVQTKIEKYQKVTDDFKDYQYVEPVKSPIGSRKITIRKVLLSKQKIAFQDEYKDLLSQEIQAFKKALNYKPRRKRGSEDKNSPKVRNFQSPNSSFKRNQPTRKHQSQFIPPAYKRLFQRNNTRLDSSQNASTSSPKKHQVKQNNQSNDIPQSFIIKDGNLQRFHTLIPQPMRKYSSSGKFEEDIISLDGENNPQKDSQQSVSDDLSNIMELQSNHYVTRQCCINCNKIKNSETLHVRDPWKLLTQRIQKLRNQENKKRRRLNSQNNSKESNQKEYNAKTEKLKEVRRRQFFNFFADFYDKYEDGAFSKDLSFNFSDEEKEANLKRYFKKYYKDDQFLPSVVVELPIACDIAAQKRLCDCLEKSKNLALSGQSSTRKQKTIKVKMMVSRVENRLNREQYLGKSQGIQNSFIIQEEMQELNQQLEQSNLMTLHKRSKTAHGASRNPEEMVRRTSISQKIKENTFDTRIKRISDLRNLRNVLSRKGQVVTESFNKAFPDYHQILSKYGSSRIFKANLDHEMSATQSYFSRDFLKVNTLNNYIINQPVGFDGRFSKSNINNNPLSQQSSTSEVRYSRNLNFGINKSQFHQRPSSTNRLKIEQNWLSNINSTQRVNLEFPIEDSKKQSYVQL